MLNTKQIRIKTESGGDHRFVTISAIASLAELGREVERKYGRQGLRLSYIDRYGDMVVLNDEEEHEEFMSHYWCEPGGAGMPILHVTAHTEAAAHGRLGLRPTCMRQWWGRWELSRKLCRFRLWEESH